MSINYIDPLNPPHPFPHKITFKLPTFQASKPTMSRPPMKPHFFTFVCSDPSSRNGSVIPKSFILKYLKGVRFDFALLKRGSRSWAVELSDVPIKGETARVFSNGWDKVEKDNGFKTGDFIVFRLEGNLVFEILVFDPTLCEREFPIDKVMEGKKSLPKGTTSKQPTTNIHRSKEMHTVKADEDATFSKTEHHPSFSSTLKMSNIKKSGLNIPLAFAKSNGLRKKCRQVILKDEKQRSWPVMVRHDATHVCLSRGWSNFCITNGLKEGDEFVIELIKHGDKPIMKFCLINQNNKFVKTRVEAKQLQSDTSDPIIRSEKRKCLKREEHDIDLEAQTNEQESKFSSSPSAKDHFVGILKPYSIKKSHLYFPMEFTKSNGLTNGQMILENENGKMWLVELRRRDTGSVYISRGWNEFRISNNLKEGDGFKLELLENTGKLPIAKFSFL